MLTSLEQLECGREQCIMVLVKNVENLVGRNGSSYQKLDIRDTCEHETVLWNWNEPISAKTPVVIKANIVTEAYNGNKSSKLSYFELEPNQRIDAYLAKSHIDLKKEWSMLASYLKKLSPGFKDVVQAVIQSEQKRFKSFPLGKTYARQCGILEATVLLTKLADSTADAFPEKTVNKEILLAGAMLYYIGSIDTMDEASNATPDAFLIGNGVAAYSILLKKVDELKAKKANVPSDDELRLLYHILLSRAKGVSAATAEAVILQKLSAIVTETDAISSALKDADPGSIVNSSGEVFHKVYKS